MSKKTVGLLGVVSYRLLLILAQSSEKQQLMNFLKDKTNILDCWTANCWSNFKVINLLMKVPKAKYVHPCCVISLTSMFSVSKLSLHDFVV